MAMTEQEQPKACKPCEENYAYEVLRYEYYRVRMSKRIATRNETEHCCAVATKETWQEWDRQERELRAAMDLLAPRKEGE